MSLPIIDLGPFTDPSCSDPAATRIAAEMNDLLSETGFVVLANHGVEASAKHALLRTLRPRRGRNHIGA
jgi:isopenicillin N synthase-like dioxygenase